MTEYRIGCSGWSYKTWSGPFYPSGVKAGDFLRLYSKVFDTVEIDSTFYNIPPASVVSNWAKNVPDGFLFSPKMPGTITHDNRLANVEVLLDKFLESIMNLGGKLGMILIQLPPSFSYERDRESLRGFVENLPNELKFAVEFRHHSLFREDIYSLLENNGVTLAWSEIPMTGNPGVSTTTNAYLRLVGDRSIKDEDFGKIQKNRDDEMTRWSDKLKSVRDDVDLAYIYSNNHFQGFGPGTVNLFREKLGIPMIDWSGIQQEGNRGSGQRTLF